MIDIVTGASSSNTKLNRDYYLGSLNLLSSIYSNANETVNKIYYLNFDLEKEKIDFLNSLLKVEVINIPKEIHDLYYDYGNVKWQVIYVWAMKYLQNENKLFWIDAGIRIKSNLKFIEEMLDREGYCFFTHFLNNCHLFNKNFMSYESILCLNISSEFLNNIQLMGGMWGYNSKFAFMRNFIDQLYNLATIRELTFPYGDNHRMIQSLLSFTAFNYGIKNGLNPDYDFDIHRTYNNHKLEELFLLTK